MAISLLQSSFLPYPHYPSSFKPHRPKYVHPAKPLLSTISFRNFSSPDQEYGSPRNDQLAKLTLVALAAGVLSLGSVDPAVAAKTGGRVGGQAFRSTAPPPRSAAPRINNSRSNVYINPPMAPPLVGSPFYGGWGWGWGWSPFSFFAPASVGAGGLDLFVLFIVLSVVSAAFRRFFRSKDDDEYY